MHLLLTDRLSCPRCGPEFGLILLAHRLDDRRVHEGELGCPNCRDSFPVRNAFADLRPPPRGPLPHGLVGAPPPSDPGGAPDQHDREEAHRLLALIGIVGGPGMVVLVGAPARHAAALAAASEELQVVAIDPDVAAWPDTPRVSRLVAGPVLPFFSRMVRGVVVDGRAGAPVLVEAARLVAPRSRLMVVNAPPPAAGLLEEEGLEVLAAEGETVVAARG